MEYLRVGPIEFYGAGFQQIIGVKDISDLEARLALYNFHQPDLWIGDAEGKAWKRSQPIYVHCGAVPVELFGKSVTANQIQKMLGTLRKEAESEARKRIVVKGALTFGTFNISVDGKTLHVIVWDNWNE